MTALPSSHPDPWRLTWRIVTGNIPLAVSLLLLAFYLLLLAWIPQFSPESAAVDRWLVQTRFGPWTGTMYRLGVFSLAYSPLLTVLLSVIGFLVLVRGMDGAAALYSRLRGERMGGEGWQATAFLTLAHLGALILLLGLLVAQRWGWREEGIIALEGGRVPGRDEVPRVYVVRFGLCLTVRATDRAGRPVDLQQTVRDGPQRELVLYLNPSAPETSFALPERAIVVRLGIQEPFSGQSPVQIEVFRAPGGERIQEARTDQDLFRLTVDETTLEIVRKPYPLLAAVYDPGLWLKRVGLVLGTLSLAGALWPWRSGDRAGRIFLLILTLAAGGLSAWNLETVGTLGEAVPFQTEVSALWLIGLAVWLIRTGGR